MEAWWNNGGIGTSGLQGPQFNPELKLLLGKSPDELPLVLWFLHTSQKHVDL